MTIYLLERLGEDRDHYTTYTIEEDMGYWTSEDAIKKFISDAHEAADRKTYQAWYNARKAENDKRVNWVNTVAGKEHAALAAAGLREPMGDPKLLELKSFADWRHTEAKQYELAKIWSYVDVEPASELFSK